MGTCTVKISLTTGGGADPISGYLSWSDGAGYHSMVPINMPYPGTWTSFTIVTPPTTINVTGQSSGFNNSTKSVSCGGELLLDLTPVGSSGGGSGSSSGDCFIVGAAYGHESAPEVKQLQRLRDNVLRRTRWGDKFFAELAEYYYRVSPAIAGEMHHDPALRRILRFAIVEPWLNYIKLMLARPDLKSIDLRALDPKLRAFLLQFQADAEKWIKEIELPTSFKGRDPFESVGELNIVLGLVLLRTDGRAYLDKLEKQGELPLHYAKEQEPKLRHALTEAGRTEDEVASILHGTHRR